MKIRGHKRLPSFEAESLYCVIPAWSAGIQADMDVSGRILRIWMPAIHAGMTKYAFSFSAGERRIMNHFVEIPEIAGVSYF